MKKNLYKSNKNKILCGVCGGIAEFANCDPTIIRLIFIVLCIFKGAGVLLYLLAAFIIPFPTSTDDLNNEDVENLKNANVESANSSSTDNKPHSDEEFETFFKKSK